MTYSFDEHLSLFVAPCDWTLPYKHHLYLLMLHHVGPSLVTCLLHCSQLSKSRANCHVGAAELGPARSYNIRQRRRTHGVGGGQLPDHWWSYYSVISVIKVRLLAWCIS